MSSSATPTGATPTGTPRPEKQAQKNAGKKEVKILMIHGYTQSGPLFRAKTRALEKLLAKTLAPISLLPVLFYPTGPNRLLPQDIPGFVNSSSSAESQGGDAITDPADLPDTWGWFRKDDGSNTYRLFNEGMAVIAEAIREAGGIDAVCGFSQGGAMAGFIAAALEPSRPVLEGPAGEWARKLREANGNQPVKFAISYSGFYAAVDSLQWLYEPKIKTPTLHYIGSLDTVVDESRSQGLVDRCEEPLVVVHPGGHYVPVSKEWVMPLAGFIKNHASGQEAS
ncbi:dihydrofolate reductase [Trichoderma asperellum]|uniref:Dihydrofolate reductase n=1 Tax=Trichoderma asperellum TaxID=101201 RepID=A0A6V8QZF4_TRIAP|nr:FSH1-domain-containing protein [Trichoderma asperelloides]GFP57402.1 dihydrofolate reductase [Trichoderma asperellum]